MNAAHRPHAIAYLIVAWAAIACNVGALTNGFSYDDAGPLVQSEFTHHWANLPALVTRAYFDSSQELSYRPVGTFSFFVDYALWGGAAWGYHAQNLAWHALAALALYWVLIAARCSRWQALAAGLLFAVYPNSAEAVCSIGFRREALYAALSLLAIGAAIRWLHPGARLSWLVAAMLCATASMFAKEPGVVTPALFMLVAWRRGCKRARAAAAAAALTACAVAYAVVRFGLLVYPSESAIRGEWSAQCSGLIGSVRTVGTYLGLLAWPPGAAIVYDSHYLLSALSGAVSLGLALAIFTVAICRSPRRLPLFALGVGWTLVALAPASNLVPTGCIVANRLMYLASAGVCIALASLTRSRPVLLGMVVAFAALLGPRCFEWRDDITLWQAAVRRSPASALAQVNLAVAYDLAGRDRWAARLYERVLERQPNHAKVRFNLAKILHERGERRRAETEYRRAIDADPSMPAAWCCLAKLYRENGRPDKAAALLHKALALGHDAADIHNALGLALRDVGRREAALAEFDAAIRDDPGHLLALCNRARMLIALGRRGEAKRELNHVLRLRPSFPPALRALRALR